MLVRAGALAPRGSALHALHGAELVGHSIRVYWPGSDRMFRGVVTEYDEVDEIHRILYEDGEDVWEELGSDLAPEYVLDPA